MKQENSSRDQDNNDESNDLDNGVQVSLGAQVLSSLASTNWSPNVITEKSNTAVRIISICF